MVENLEVIYSRLETQREEIMKMLQGFNQSKLMWKPDANRWSVMEILQHLITSEQLTLSYMTKKSNAIETLADTGWIESVKMLGFSVSQRLPLRFKAPKMIVPLEVRDSLHDYEMEWKESRVRLMEFLNQLKKEHLKRKIYRHPFAGRFNCLQALQIMYEHINHHRPQITRLLTR